MILNQACPLAQKSSDSKSKQLAVSCIVWQCCLMQLKVIWYRHPLNSCLRELLPKPMVSKEDVIQHTYRFCWALFQAPATLSI